jgi:uncharacterized lipoprotein YmbA
MTMHIDIRTARRLAPAILLVLAGCFHLSRQSPPLRHYALAGAAQPGAASGTSTSTAATTPVTTGLTIGLRRLDLASYLQVPAVMVRRGATELIVSEFHRWGGELDEAINQAVATHLAGLPPVKAVEVAPWQAQTRHDFLLQLHVLRFEGVADSAATQGRVHMQAGWDIVRPLDGRVMVRGMTDDRSGAWRVGDYSALVAGLDAALGRMARDISTCLSRFPNDSTPPASCGSGAGTGAGR